MNILLFYSSITCSIINVYYALSINYWSKYMDFLLIQLATSLLHTGYDQYVFELLNRSIMLFGLFLDMRILLSNSIIDRTTILYLQGITIGCYLFAKVHNNTKMYACSQILLTVTRLCMISSVYYGCRYYRNENIALTYRSYLCN